MTYQLYKFFAPLILLFENPTTWIVLALSIIAVCGMVVVRFGNSSTADWNKVLRMAAASVGFLALVSTTWLAPTLIAGAIDDEVTAPSQILVTEISAGSD